MILSSYELRARLVPGLLGIAPVSVAVASLGLNSLPSVAIVGTVVTAAGGTYLLSVLVGGAGRRAQPQLWAKWGGPPTLRMLRLLEPSTNPTRRDKWRAALSALTEVDLLSAADEAARPQEADDAIETAIGQCLYLGHGGERGAQLVQAENAQYGLARNLVGFRWAGRLIALICVAALVAALISPWEVSQPAVIAGIVVDAGFLLLWVFVPSEERARLASERYATQLLNAVVEQNRTSRSAS